MAGEVTPHSTERDYMNALLNARTLTELRAALVPWARFCPTAKTVADRMTDQDFKEFRIGYHQLFQPGASGDVTQNFQSRYGDLMVPPELQEASKKAEAHNTTIGVVLLAVWGN
jgi:hypothetical protein